MAIILGGRTTCALCGEVIGELDAIFATSHFIGDCSHPFWRYSDAAMHQRCFLVWTERAEFVRCFNDIHKRHPSLKGTYLRMSEAGEIQVLQNDHAV